MAKAKTTTKKAAAKTTTTKATAKKTATNKTAAKKTSATKVKVKTGGPATSNQIATRAYQIWESQGCPEGQAADHWAQAESELNG